VNFSETEIMRFVNVVLIVLVLIFWAIFGVVGFLASMDLDIYQGSKTTFGAPPIPLKTAKSWGDWGRSHQSFSGVWVPRSMLARNPSQTQTN
jgi:hypothetical protein